MTHETAGDPLVSRDHEVGVQAGPAPGPFGGWVHPPETPYICPANDLGKLIGMAMEDDPAKRDATATLWAAAPDLLDALKMCVIERSEWLQEARAAIAKATAQTGGA